MAKRIGLVGPCQQLSENSELFYAKSATFQPRQEKFVDKPGSQTNIRNVQCILQKASHLKRLKLAKPHPYKAHKANRKKFAFEHASHGVGDGRKLFSVMKSRLIIWEVFMDFGTIFIICGKKNFF